MGRMACEGGKTVTWEEAMNSDLQLAPNLDSISDLSDPAPVSPNSQGQYDVAMPGQTQVV
jgi:hypothetical protein